LLRYVGAPAVPVRDDQGVDEDRKGRDEAEADVAGVSRVEASLEASGAEALRTAASNALPPFQPVSRGLTMFVASATDAAAPVMSISEGPCD